MTFPGSVVRKTSVTTTGTSVEESFISEVLLLLTVEGAVVGPRLMLPSLVWDESHSVPSWFRVLELWAPVVASVDVPTLDPDPSSVPETFTGVKEGGVEETETSDWLVLSSVTQRGGVESGVSCAVEEC